MKRWKLNSFLMKVENGALVPANESVLATMRDFGFRDGDELLAHLHRPDGRKHGYVGTRTYRAWAGAIDRCHNQKNHAYWLYGGAGINVCSRWRQQFTHFLADMGPSPTTKHHLDRADPAKGYNKENCRWVTATQNAANVRKRRGKSGYRGVDALPSGKFRAQVRSHGKRYELGVFDDARLAAIAYDECAREVFGEQYAMTNARMGWL